MLKKQKEAAGEAVVTTVLFSNKSNLLHDRINIKEVTSITEREYEVGGMTALLDAVGSTIQKVSNVQKTASEAERANRVLFVITTDGLENASEEYDAETVKRMIAHQKQHYDWEFIFLGANIDALSTAASFGIHEDFAVTYHADSEGTQVNFETLNEAVTTFREGQKMDRTWKKKIERDFKTRQ